VTKQESKEVKDIYPMTGGFGALTRSPAFHLNTQWQIRQSPYIASIFANILGTDKIMVNLDRTSLKFPGQGTTEFIHWDTNPFYWQEEISEGVQGILALSDTSFFAVPGTNSDKFRNEFVKKYPKIADKSEYKIDPNNDPMRLQDKIKEYRLEKGDMVIWSSRLLHSAKKNTGKKIRYAYFISYFIRDQYPLAVKDWYSRNGIDPIDDRLESFYTGKNPMLFPSGIPIRLYSKMSWMCHINNLTEFSLKFKYGYKDDRHKSGKKAGEIFKVPIEWNPLEMGFYTPPKLTKLGKYLLGETDTYY
jgi:hypothetical protein